jgi:starch-binding outer membrane protein, SusD/RagB family
MKNTIIPSTLLFISCSGMFSCIKKDLLHSSPSSEFSVPTSLEELQGLLDNDMLMNSSPVLGEVSSDEMYFSNSLWQHINTREKNAYTWEPTLFGNDEVVDDWFLPYQQVFYANFVLQYLPSFETSSLAKKRNQVKGDALFKRAYAFYNLAQLFALPFDQPTADVDPGIPLRLDADINTPSRRSTVRQTYEQILSDLLAARSLLPNSIDSAKPNRPSVPAVFAMLSRVFLSMRNYYLAEKYADSCLNMYSKLMDFNQIDWNSLQPFEHINREAIYQTRFHNTTDCMVGYYITGCVIDSNLYKLYDINDLRRYAFFTINEDNLPNIKGSYYGGFQPFSGLAIDEVYLTRAECRTRQGNTTSALNDLNSLLEKRWKAGSFIPITATPSSELLNIILTERKKELVFRGLRWTDVRRLNKENQGITLKRIVEGRQYLLPPNDKRYALSIPPAVIAKTGMQQNPR